MTSLVGIAIALAFMLGCLYATDPTSFAHLTSVLEAAVR